MLEAKRSALAHSFEEDGFAIARGFFSQETVAEICRRAEKILDQRTEFSRNYTNITKGLEKADGFFAQLLNSFNCIGDIDSEYRRHGTVVFHDAAQKETARANALDTTV